MHKYRFFWLLSIALKARRDLDCIRYGCVLLRGIGSDINFRSSPSSYSLLYSGSGDWTLIFKPTCKAGVGNFISSNIWWNSIHISTASNKAAAVGKKSVTVPGQIFRDRFLLLPVGNIQWGLPAYQNLRLRKADWPQQRCRYGREAFMCL